MVYIMVCGSVHGGPWWFMSWFMVVCSGLWWFMSWFVVV